MSRTDERIGLHRLSVEITNRSEVQVIVYVEPWGDQFELEPTERIRIDIVSPTLRAIPISYAVDSITIEGWEGTISEVWKGRDRLN